MGAVQAENGFRHGSVHAARGQGGKESCQFRRGSLLLQGVRVCELTEQGGLGFQPVVQERREGVVRRMVRQEGKELPHRHGSGAAPRIVKGKQEADDFGVQIKVSAHFSQHGRQLLRGEGPAQGGSVAGQAADVVVLFQPLDQLRYLRLIPVLIDQDHSIPLGENVGHGVVLYQSVGDAGLGLQKIESHKQKNKKNSQDIAHFVAEPGRPVHPDLRRLFGCFEQQPVKQQNEGRQNGQHADHAEEHALGQHQTHIRANLEAHKHQHQQSRHGGQRAGGYGGKGLCPGVFHGLEPIRFQGPFLSVPAHQNDRVVHGQTHLQDYRHRVGDAGHAAQKEVGSRIDHHRAPDGRQEQEGLQPGPAHGKQDRKQKNHNHHVDDEGNFWGA